MAASGSDKPTGTVSGSACFKREERTVIKVDLLNFLIVWAFIIIGRFVANLLAGLTANTPVGKALSLVAA